LNSVSLHWFGFFHLLNILHTSPLAQTEFKETRDFLREGKFKSGRKGRKHFTQKNHAVRGTSFRNLKWALYLPVLKTALWLEGLAPLSWGKCAGF